jgi:hypothetical protein
MNVVVEKQFFMYTGLKIKKGTNIRKPTNPIKVKSNSEDGKYLFK